MNHMKMCLNILFDVAKPCQVYDKVEQDQKMLIFLVKMSKPDFEWRLL